MKTLTILATLTLALGTGVAADEPLLKEGLWSIHTATVDNPGGKKMETNRSICRDHAYDARVRASAKGVNCKTISENNSGGARTKETECTAGGSVIRTKATVTSSGENAAHSETHTTMTPPLYGRAESTMIMDQKYVGSCPAGIEPGDMIAADGSVTHLGRRK